MRLKRKDHEHEEQCKLFAWAKEKESMHLHLGLMFAIPNGGHRHKGVAVKLKNEGVKSGVPDVFLAVPKNGKSGLFLEMKYGKNKPSVNQKWWLESLRAEGYETAVCYGFEQARDKIISYLELETR